MSYCFLKSYVLIDNVHILDYNFTVNKSDEKGSTMLNIMTVILSVISFILNLFGLPGYPCGDKIDLEKFNLSWSDEFEGNTVDSSKWKSGWDGDAAVRKGGYWDKSMCTVSDGKLHIATKYYPEGLNGNGKAGWYSAKLETKGLFEQKYGYYEVRCILPKGTGLWSAFWMMCEGVFNVDGSGKDGSEIDIYESAYYSSGKNSDTVSSAIHYDGYGDAHKSTTVHQTHVYGSNPYEEFNTYGVEWNENGYTFYINGVKCGKSDFGGVSDVPEYMLLSVEVGGENGTPADSWAGASIETNTEAPTDFIVDYVRVYQYK